NEAGFPSRGVQCNESSELQGAFVRAAFHLVEHLWPDHKRQRSPYLAGRREVHFLTSQRPSAPDSRSGRFAALGWMCDFPDHLETRNDLWIALKTAAGNFSKQVRRQL